MFSNDDIREIHQLFPPPTVRDGDLALLVLASNGQGFVTSKSLQNEFDRLATKAPTRISVSDLSKNLDVDRDTVLQLARRQVQSVLVSNDSSKIVPRSERDEIERKVQEKLSSTFLSKQKFASENDIEVHSLDSLLANHPELADHDDLVCTRTLEHDLSDHISGHIDAVISNIANNFISLKDAEQLPGSPPLWFVLWHFRHIIRSRKLEEEVFLRESPTRIECQSRKLKAHNVKARVKHLVTSERPYIDLRVVLKESPDIYESPEDVRTAFSKEANVEIVDSYVLSKSWFQHFVSRSLQDLHYDGIMNVAQQIEKQFPEPLHNYATSRSEKDIMSAAAEKTDLNLTVHNVGSFIVTDEQYNVERSALLEYAKKAGVAQWELRKDNHEHELKFNLPTDSSANSSNHAVREALLREKAIEKATDEQFWASISEHESQNEADFAVFWTERVTSRLQNYTFALDAVEDAKLKTQLDELLATYIHKELVPDAISKAQAQSLILSRRTNKNIKRFQTTLHATKPDVPALVSVIDKFNKKQGINPPTDSAVEENKKTMINDMSRRMQKQQKPSDGPVLFLTLVIVLFAKHNPGVVYATGKFAPKLLKQLKAKLLPEEYERLEAWKEAAKAGTLGAEDREAMRTMADS